MEAIAVAFNKSIAAEFDLKLKSRKVGNFPPTPQQVDFIQAFATQRDSLLAEAVAGSGKTTTLLTAALAVPNASWTCKTMHGLGYMAWQNKIGRRLIVDSDKLFKILKKYDGIEREMFGPVLALARLGKTAGIVPKNSPRGNSLLLDETETWEDLADHYNEEFSDEILYLTRKLLNDSIIAGQSGSVDFDDMLYLPVCFSGVFHKHDLVLVDEVQDLSAIQHVMLRKTLAKTGVLCAVGDRNQAIYGFRGALADSIPALIEDFSLSTYPLTVSFRCPKAVVREAQTVVPHIQSFDGAPEGDVIYHPEMTLRNIPQTVLCRNTAPLINLALRLIGAGRGAKIAGRDIGKSLARLVKKISPAPCKLSVFSEKLDAFVEGQISRKPRVEQSMRDKQAALEAICNRAQAMSAGLATSDTIADIITELYDRNAPGAVYLSTIHKAKGLEWQEVLFLDPQLIPSCYASRDWQYQQERNLKYVGVTRAQQVLHYTESETIL